MKILLFHFLLLVASLSAVEPAIKVTNRAFPDGSGGSSKEINSEKKQSVESFYDGSGKTTYKIVYALDDRLQPLSGVYYNNAGKVFQKSSYKLDGVNRIVQEIVFNPADKLVCTKNYVYGVVKGKDTIIEVDTFDARAVLVSVSRLPSTTGARRR